MSSNSGSHRNTGSSLSGMVSTLVPCAIVAGVLVGLFLVLRRSKTRLYAPRTFHDKLYEDEKTPSAGKSFLGWIKNYRAMEDEYVLNHHSMDAYLYIRFLKMLVLMCFVGAVLTWPVLFPVNITGGGGQSGLDILSFSNVNGGARYFAHAIMAWVFFGWVLFLIGREMRYLVKLRQAYLLSTWNASRISQRTVLFTDVPEKDLSLERLHTMFPQVAQIWLVPDVSDFEDDVEELDKAVPKLEKSETKFMKKVTKQQQKQNREKSSGFDKALRPTNRTKPLIGHKVDSIGYYRNQIKELLPKIQTAQRSHLAGKGKLTTAVFIEFTTMAAAEAAYNTNHHKRPAKFDARQMGVLPQEVIWKNLGMGSKNRRLRHLIATLIMTALIIFWTIPVALVGIISNVNYLTSEVPFLEWINDIPDVILGVVTGLLPAILLAILVALVPKFCRLLAKLAGAATLSEVEEQTQTWHFAFQVIQVFLVTTFTSGAAAVVTDVIENPTQAPQLLAENLPKASNFYISFFILYGLAMSARYLFNLIGLLGVFVLSKFAKTPRQKYMRYISFTEPSWGAEYPRWTNLGVIAISYACIAPLLLGFATVGLGLIYLAYRYNMLYVHDTHIDTKGGFYARALDQLLVGVYIGELCLLGLFGIGVGGSVISVGPTVLQFILIVATIIFHVFMKRKIKQLDLLGEDHHPANMDAEGGRVSTSHGKYSHGTRALVSGYTAADREYKVHTGSAAAGMTPPSNALPKRSLFKRIFSPHTLSASELSAGLIPRFCHPVPAYSERDVLEAYLHPALAQREEVIWLARDGAGVSRQEVAGLHESLSSYGVLVTDEGAIMNEKGKVVWEESSVRQAPLWGHRDRVVY